MPTEVYATSTGVYAMPPDVRVAYTGSYATCTEVYATRTLVFATCTRVGVAYTGVRAPPTAIYATRTRSFAMRVEVGDTYTGLYAMRTGVFATCTLGEKMSADSWIPCGSVDKAAVAVAAVYGPVAVSWNLRGSS
jgi:hypothetical protein